MFLIIKLNKIGVCEKPYSCNGTLSRVICFVFLSYCLLDLGIDACKVFHLFHVPIIDPF